MQKPITSSLRAPMASALGSAFLVAFLAACGKPSGRNKSCQKSSAQGFVGAGSKEGGGFGLADPLPARAVAANPRITGGAIHFKTVDGELARNVASEKFSTLKFTRNGTCSAVFEFRKEGTSYKVDAFTSSSCLAIHLLARGQGPTLSVYRPLSKELLDGYEKIPVGLKLLEQRDKALLELEKIADATLETRRAFFNWGVLTERVVHSRAAVSSDAPLGTDLCLKVPDQKIAEYAALSAAEQEKVSDPESTDFAYPEACQMLVPGQWYAFDVPDASAAEHKTLLDELVAETTAYKGFQRQHAGVTAELQAKLESLRKASDEDSAFEARWRRYKLLNFALDANPASASTEGKALAGPNKEAYIELAKTIFAPDLAAEAKAAKDGNYTPDARLGAKNKFLAAVSEGDAKALIYLQTLRDIHLAMKAQKDRVGIATNHIAHFDTKTAKVSPTGQSLLVTFKDLALFPKDSAAPEELFRHTFSLTNNWLEMTFDKSKEHPAVNNLRHPLNDGFAVTFAGVPVGAPYANIDQSGGASVINLPVRKKNDSAQWPSPNDASNDRGNKGRETTVNDGC